MGRHLTAHAASRTNSQGAGELPAIMSSAPAPANSQSLGVLHVELSDAAYDRIAQRTADEIERRRTVAAQPEHVPVERAAEVLHCDGRTIRRLVARGELRGFRAGGGRSRLLIEAASVDELIRRRMR